MRRFPQIIAGSVVFARPQGLPCARLADVIEIINVAAQSDNDILSIRLHDSNETAEYFRKNLKLAKLD